MKKLFGRIVRFTGLLVLASGLWSCEDDREIKLSLFQDCYNHYRAESYKVASRTCLVAAEYGIARAQWLLANIYYYDLAQIESTRAQAFEWFVRAADNGLPEAQTFVGESYLYADGVDEDFVKAFNYLNKAAKLQDPQAEYAIAMMFYNGQGRTKDVSAAISWLKKAASKQHSMSINNLAWLYATNKSQSFRNAKKAMFWAQKLMLDPRYPENDSTFLDTKAAAYALAGNFGEAIKLQNQAIEALPDDIEEETLVEFQQRLETYQSESAWVEITE